MKHTTSPVAKEPTAVCLKCRTEMPKVMLRQVTLEPSYVCRNEAACRKRQRQHAMKVDPKGAKKS